MKIRLLSDLHMEGYQYYYEYAGEDIVVLAGDIHTQSRHDFLLDQIPSNVKVLMVAGNHEYYDSEFHTMNKFLKGKENRYSNFKFLLNESVTIDGIEFFGGTMFTDFELYGIHERWFSEQLAKSGVADFHWINKRLEDGREVRWSTQDHINQHVDFITKLDEWIMANQDKKKVVISHFVPHKDGSHPKFSGSKLNPYFVCDMERFMGDIDLWLYGHTHTSKDMVAEGCRLVCNPRGYGEENREGYVKDLIVEI